MTSQLIKDIEGEIDDLRFRFSKCYCEDRSRPCPECRDGYYQVDLLNQALEALKAREWQPISTAPKDGTHIELAAIGHSDRLTTGNEIIRDPTLSIWWVAKGNWSERFGKFWDGLEPSGFANLTHWRPFDPNDIPEQGEA